MDKLLIKKSDKYIIGVGGIRAMLNGDKKRAIDFENNLSIEVTKEEYKKINAHNWCVEVKNGNYTENINEISTDRNNSTTENK